MMRIAIIGGGATGVLTALHLTCSLQPGMVELLVIEPTARLGRGLAYSTDDPRHMLNVRVANMSAFADRPDHLFQWLLGRGSIQGVSCLTPFCFIPRGIYGEYVANLAEKLVSSGAIRHIRARCIDLIEERSSVTLRLDSNQVLAVDLAILATGHDLKPDLYGVPTVQPWIPGALNGLGSNAPVLIKGTGLTMVDMVLSLDRLGHRGKITALSHRGLLPSAHRHVHPVALTSTEIPFGAELSLLVRWFRDFTQIVDEGGGDWRAAVDALRPYTQRLWCSMSSAQKQRFLRHARALWDVHRHRMAPEVERQITTLRTAGRLEIVAGRIVRAEAIREEITVKIALRGARREEARTFVRLIDCSGLAGDPRSSSNPLIQAILARGAARIDPLGIGLDVDNECALISASGQNSERVRVIGPLARAAFWECIAIPDIRLQCRNLAEAIAAETNIRTMASEHHR